MPNSTDAAIEAASDRQEALAALRRVRSEAEYKSLGEGRIRDPEHEKIRVRYLKVIVSACNAERRLLRDRDLDDLAQEVDALADRLDADDSPSADVLAADGGES